MESLELLPLGIKRARFVDAPVSRYRIHLADGRSIVVEAGTAAEAMSLGGVDDAVRIVPLAFMPDDVTDRPIEATEEAEHTTDLTGMPSRLPFFTAEMAPEGPPPGFEEMTIESLVQTQPLALGAPVAGVADEMPALPPPPVRKPCREEKFVLSSEDVERLLAGNLPLTPLPASDTPQE